MFRVVLLSAVSALMMSACASSKFKERQIQRDKVAASAGMYCEFISGDMFPDLDVELNMKMASRCDANRNFSITNFKNASDQNGVIYCCAMAGQKVAAPARKAAPAVTAAPAPAAAAASAAPAAPAKTASEEEVLEEQ